MRPQRDVRRAIDTRGTHKRTKTKSSLQQSGQHIGEPGRNGNCSLPITPPG